MKGMKNVFSKTEFAVFIFTAGWILFNWPIITMVNCCNPKSIFAYLFAVWGVGIFILFLTSLSYKERDDTKR